MMANLNLKNYRQSKTFIKLLEFQVREILIRYLSMQNSVPDYASFGKFNSLTQNPALERAF